MARDFFGNKDLYFVVHHNTQEAIWETHLHDFVEFYFVLSDNVQIETDYGTYNTSYGDLLMFKEFCFHKIIADGIQFDRYVFGFRESSLLNEMACLREAVERIEQQNLFYLKTDPDICKNLVALFEEAIAIPEEDYPMRNFDICSCIGRIIKVILSLPHSQEGSIPPQKEFAKILDYIQNHIADDVRIRDISQKFSMSNVTLHKIFKEHLGVAPGEYILRTKLNLAIDLLRNGNSVTETANLVGFNSYAHFIRIFKQRVGLSPKQFAQSYRMSFDKYTSPQKPFEE